MTRKSKREIERAVEGLRHEGGGDDEQAVDLTERQKAALRALLATRRENPISGAEDWPPTREAIEEAKEYLDDEHVATLEAMGW